MSDELARRARDVLAGNRYLVLGTVDPDGRPRVSPVYFTMAGWHTVYWISSRDAHHSRNLAGRPAVGMVVFDSAAEVGRGRAVYLEADAAEVPAGELVAACAEAFAGAGKGARSFTPEELSDDDGFRLYRARITAVEVHVPGRDPEHGTGTDRRQAVRI